MQQGSIVLLNGAPRSGKSSIAQAMQQREEVWINLGVDNYMRCIPARYQPGIGLRPGGERPDLEPVVEKLYLALYQSLLAHSRQGINTVVDIGHHDNYSAPLYLFARCAQIIAQLPVMVVGVYCPVDIIMQRRVATWHANYSQGDAVPAPVLRWQQSVHALGIYDLRVDTSQNTPEECAAQIEKALLAGGPFGAIKRIAALAP